MGATFMYINSFNSYLLHVLLRKPRSREFQKLAQSHEEMVKMCLASFWSRSGAVTNCHEAGGFKIETHSLVVLEVRGPKARGCHALLEGSRGVPFFAPPGLWGCWQSSVLCVHQHQSRLCCYMAFPLCVSVQIPLFY